ncbi:MAG: hypothetical protein CML31_08000 [Rhizobiales bacterium]|nr:hypothetical protein [Hyphomicrobiales bacterium]
MSSIIYWGVVAAGAATLLIEAWRNFDSSLSSTPFREHPILRNVKVSKLSTTREQHIGYAFYSLLYIAAYVLVLSSVEVYGLLQQVAQNASEIGPSEAVQFANSLSDGDIDYGKPIFVSASIIAVLSLKAVEPVERAMRLMAHRLAGIPRGIYGIIDVLHAIEYEKLDRGNTPTPLTQMFEERWQKSFSRPYDAGRLNNLKSALLTIDFLAPALTGNQRIQHFPFSQLESMSTLSAQLSDEVEALRRKLSAFPGEEEEGARSELYSSSMNTANDAIALFSVHYIRNNRAIKNLHNNVVLRSIYASIKSAYRVELNSFGMAVFISVFLSLFVAHWSVFSWSIVESGVDRAAITANFAKYMPNSDELKLWNDKKCLSDGKYISSEECEYLISSAVDSDHSTRRREIFEYIVRVMVPLVLSTIAAAAVTIMARQMRHEDNSWPRWQLRRFPFVRMISLSILPAIVAVLVLAMAGCAILWVDTSFQLTENQLTIHLKSNGVYYLLNFLPAFIISMCVLVLIDQHDEFPPEITVSISVIFAVFLIYSYYVCVIFGYPEGQIRTKPSGWGYYSFEIREVIVNGSFSVIFVIVFSVFLEMTENNRASRQSILLRFFKGQRRRHSGGSEGED